MQQTKYSKHATTLLTTSLHLSATQCVRVTVKCHLRLLHTLLLLQLLMRLILIFNSSALPATFRAIIPNVECIVLCGAH